MNLFGKTLLCFICFNLAQIPLMAENVFSTNGDNKQIEVEIIKQPQKIKPVKQLNTPKGYRTPHIQSKCKYISEIDEIHQVGLNITQFMDIENFKALPRYFGGNKKADNKRDITINAVQYFIDLGLSDSKEINKENEFKHGDVFFFGKYEQDGNKENGQEPIEWIVLRDTGKEIILLSKYVLAHKPFDTTNEMFIWQNSTLCSWLNNDFYNMAFNEDEKRRMGKIGSDWYAEEYEGDYVVIPVLDDYSDLIDNFWLRAYAVPNDEAAQDYIDYYGKPFILTSKDKWYEYSNFLNCNQPNVLTSNEKVDKFSSFVYWPSGYWINQHNGMRSLSNGKCEMEYTFCDENGFFHTTNAKFYNGVRPVIKVAYANIEKQNK